MPVLEELDYPAFGSYAFDQFVIEQWNASSVLSRGDQKRSLVAQWLALGRYGRNIYFKRAWAEDWDAGITDQIPQDLCLKGDQYKIWEQDISVLWIRTWYGNRLPRMPADDDDNEAAATRRQAADAGYRRLWQKGFVNPDLLEEDQEVDPAIAIFDDDHLQLAIPQQDIAGDIVQVGEVPSFLIFVLMRCADLFEGISSHDWRKHDAETAAAKEPLLAKSQRFLLMIADREACERGWIYLVAIDHKGRVLPTRSRGQAAKIRYFANEWLSEGVPLSEMDEEEGDTVLYDSGGQGWDDC